MLRMIDSYNFGRICINGEIYTKDVIIRPNKVQGNWWRKQGHKLAIEDIREIIEQDNPETLVVGTGKFGLMKILPETEAYLSRNNVRIIAQKTDDACKTFNKLSEAGKVIGAFHLTC